MIQRKLSNFDKNFRRISTLYLCLLLHIYSYSQTFKIKNLPRPYLKPIDYEDLTMYNELITKECDKDKRENWLIVSDRPSNKLYNNPGGQEIGQMLDFKETAFVVEEKGEWIKVVNGGSMPKTNEMVNPKKSGWISKKNVLLWPYSMVDEYSAISRKGLLAMKYSDLSGINYRKSNISIGVSIFESPSLYKEKLKMTHGVFFVYKKEDNRVLLGKENSFNSENAKNVIIG